MSTQGHATKPSAPEIDSSLLITVSGPPGCGATTLCERLSEAMDCPYVSGGDIFRELAEEGELSLHQQTAIADSNADIDRALDKRLESIAEKWGASGKPFILESRLAGWLAGENADLRLWLDAPDEVRADRTADREEMTSEMQVREVIEEQRYKSYYGIDLSDRSIYDLAINTGRWDAEATLDLALAAIDGYDVESDEGAFDTPDFEI